MRKTQIIQTADAQLWKVVPTNWDIVSTEKLLGYADMPNLTSLDGIVKEVRGWTVTNLQLVPLSITDKDEPIVSRMQSRGYENDENPFIIRGKKMPEIEVGFWKDSEGVLFPRFNTPRFKDSLTAAQVKWFDDRYGEQLTKAITPALLKRMIRDQIKYVVEYAKQDVARLQEQLRQIKAYKVPAEMTEDEMREKCIAIMLQYKGRGARNEVDRFLRKHEGRLRRLECPRCAALLNLPTAFTPHLTDGCAYCGHLEQD